MSFNVIIPARYASSRLPGKPLADIAGKTMIQRVYECAKLSNASRVIVATDDDRVFQAVSLFGGEVCMTSPEHESGTDRLQEVAEFYQMSNEEIIVNVQGDEPLIPASVINQVANNLSNNQMVAAATLSENITDADALFDPNVVKVVAALNKEALYFSRASIPWSRDTFPGASNSASSKTIDLSLCQRHIGIYAYRVSTLNNFVRWPVSALENCEKLEQLRILANGEKIHVDQACVDVPGGVDTQDDLDRVRKLF